MSNHRQLAAILFTDIVGYTALMQESEQKAVALIKHYNSTLDKTVAIHEGTVLNYYGDGSLCIFPSATEAVNCAIDIQKELQSEPLVPLRIGLHVGEIFFEDGKALGDGVNVASRIQSLGQANTILFSKEIFDKVKNHPEFKAVSLGQFDFKNVDEPMEVFALENEGLIIPRRKRMEGKLKKKKLSSMSILIGAAFFILICFFWVFKMVFNDPKIAATERSIAVLPFVDMSSDKDQEYLGDGIAEEIINSLTTIKDLKIIGRTSSFQFKGEKIDLREIGDKLKVGIILEGSVQKYEDMIRITAQLIRAKDNTHLWSEKYDRKLTDIFKIRDDIAANITEKLKLSLSELQRQRFIQTETNPEAYNLYLKGLYAYRENKFEESIAYNKQSLQIDSNYALPCAYIALAKTWIIIQSHDFKNAQAIAEAQGYAQNAIRIDPQLAEGYSATALIARSIEHNFSKAREFFDKSLQLNPSSTLTKNRYAYFLFFMGDFDKAEKMATEALQSDPVDFNSYVVLADVYIYTGKFSEADKYIGEGLRLFPDRYEFQNLQLEKKFRSGDYKGLILDYELLKSAGKKISNPGLSRICIAYQKAGRQKESDDIFQYLKNQPGNDYSLAIVYAARNQKDSAIVRLQAFLDQGDYGLSDFKIEPTFNSLKDDARYKSLYTKYGFDNY